MVPRELARPGLIAVAALAPLVTAAIAIRYGTDGPPSTIAALVLAPAAVVATWLLAERLGGARFADAAAAVYVLLPALAFLVLLGGYRSTFADRALPDLVGLRATPWFALGLLLAAVVWARWSGPLLAIAGVALLASSWSDLGAVRVGLHETAWSIAMLEWLALAGIVGAARRSWWHALGLGGWLGCAVALAARQGYEDAAFWQSLAVATPAVAVLLSSLWLLVPRLRPAAHPQRAR